MSTIAKSNRTTKGRTPLKNRKYGAQVTKLRAGQKVTVRTAQESRGIYDTLRSLNINENFRTAKTANGFVISKRYSKK